MAVINNAEFTGKIAVLIPCYNEEKTVAQVVGNFRTALPEADFYVYDNNSTDETARLAATAGAVVRFEKRQGKGNVLRRMFSDIEKVLTGFVSLIFGRELTDMLSGYRIFSRRFVKSFPALATGFETETELTVHALELRMPVAEIITPYGMRPSGSKSKLHTYRDGFRILKTILTLFKEERPLIFFSLVFVLLASLSVILMIPIFITYIETGYVPRFPTAILSTGIMLLAFLSLFCGFILDTVTLGRRELKRLAYLSIPAPGNSGR